MIYLIIIVHNFIIYFYIMTQEIGPIITQAKGTYATNFTGQLFQNNLLLIFHEPNEQFPDKLLNC